MNWHIGIDPGKSGAIAFIFGKNISQFHTPLVGKEYDVSQMVKIITGSDTYRLENAFCVIEKVHAMPGQGVVSMFTFGYGFGLWVGIIASLRIPYILVAPQTWKKEMLKDTNRDKGASIIMAEQLFPDFRCKFKKDEALAEALLLAEYGRRIKK